VNSLDYIALAINQGNFSKAYNIETGLNWIIEFSKVEA
jgi:S-adenosylmethionine hydrolase